MKFEKIIKEYTGDNKPYRGPNLSDKESLTKELAPLISQMGKMSAEELKSKFIEILNSKEAHVSEEKKKYYMVQLDKKKNHFSLMDYIKNILLKVEAYFRLPSKKRRLS